MPARREDDDLLVVQQELRRRRIVDRARESETREHLGAELRAQIAAHATEKERRRLRRGPSLLAVLWLIAALTTAAAIGAWIVWMNA